MTEKSRGTRDARLTRAQRIGAVAGPPLARAIYSTWRVEVANDAPWRKLARDGKPFVFALWHGQLLPLVVEHRGQGVKIVISEHGDGELITRVAARLGLDAIRGSTSRGAARALLAMCAALDAGARIAVTPDGPRGPAHSFAPGALIAAQRTGAPVIAIGVAASSAWRMRSWDSFMVPKPLSRVAIAYSDPTHVEATDARAVAEEVPRFEALMRQTVERAEAMLAARAARTE